MIKSLFGSGSLTSALRGGLEEASATHRAIAQRVSNALQASTSSDFSSALLAQQSKGKLNEVDLEREMASLADTQILRISVLSELEGELNRAFEAHPDLTAIFAMTDELLVHTHHLLMRRGARIPEEVSLLAISDGQAPAFLHPNVTHFRHAGIEVGERTAHILIGMIEHGSDVTMDVRIRTTLVELGSVATRGRKRAARNAENTAV